MPNTLVAHPTNGTFHFGQVPEKRVSGILIPGAPIVLKRGKHSGRGGFGVRHIWSRHEAELVVRGYESEGDVARYVAEIVNPGACQTALNFDPGSASNFDPSGVCASTPLIRPA